MIWVKLMGNDKLNNKFIGLGFVVLPNPNENNKCSLRVVRREIELQVDLCRKTGFTFQWNELPVSKYQEGALGLHDLLGHDDTLVVTLSPKKNRGSNDGKTNYGLSSNTAHVKWVCGTIVVLMALWSCQTFVTVDQVSGDQRVGVTPGWVNPLFQLLGQIVDVICQCVLLYLSVFKDCWFVTGTWLVELVDGYYQLLTELFQSMLAWPTVIVCAICLAIALHYVVKILQVILPWAAATASTTTNNFDRLGRTRQRSSLRHHQQMEATTSPAACSSQNDLVSNTGVTQQLVPRSPAVVADACRLDDQPLLITPSVMVATGVAVGLRDENTTESSTSNDYYGGETCGIVDMIV